MPSRRRNHFIPRFLLNRFASRSSGSKRWIRQVDRNGRIKELSTKDAAVGSYFYGNPTTGVEDEFSVAEGDYHRTLQYIDRGADPNSKTTDLNRFMWSLVIRTRSLRENTANAFEHMLNESIENMKTNEAREFLRRHLAENLDNYVLEKLEEPQRTVARAMLMDPHARHFMEQFIEKEINKFDLNLFMNFFKQKFEEEKIITKAAKDGQTKGLAKIISARHVPDRFTACYWTSLTIDQDEFVLGDTCVFGLAEDGSYGTILRFGSDVGSNWKEIYMPVSSGLTLVGMKQNSIPTLTVS